MPACRVPFYDNLVICGNGDIVVALFKEMLFMFICIQDYQLHTFQVKFYASFKQQREPQHNWDLNIGILWSQSLAFYFHRQSLLLPFQLGWLLSCIFNCFYWFFIDNVSYASRATAQDFEIYAPRATFVDPLMCAHG